MEFDIRGQTGHATRGVSAPHMQSSLCCPLCHEELVASEEMLWCLPTRRRRKVKREPVKCADGWLEQLWKDKKVSGTSPATDIFLCHVGCEAENPFWDKAAKVVKLVVEDGTPSTLVDLGGEEMEEVAHWEIGMLSQVLDSLEDAQNIREMWFPSLLLRAASGPAGNQHFTRVLLAGPPTVGKTVVAMQALHSFGYVEAHRGDKPEPSRRRLFTVEHFAYSHDRIRMLKMLERLGRLEDFDPNLENIKPEPTAKVLTDLKAVFFQPPTDEPDDETSDGTHASHGILNWMRKKKDEWFEEARGSKNPQTDDPPQAPPPPTLLFYDVPGEWVRKKSSNIAFLRTVVDVVAVFVDAEDIFRKVNEGASLISAVQQLKAITAGSYAGVRHCLVVTKLDLFREELSMIAGEETWGSDEIRPERVGIAADSAKNGWNRVVEVAEKIEGRSYQKARQFLIHWLEETLKQKGFNTPRRQELCSFLKKAEAQAEVRRERRQRRRLEAYSHNRRANIPSEDDEPLASELPVFFIWTTGIPEEEPSGDVSVEDEEEVNEHSVFDPGDASARNRAASFPESCGLSKFVSWSLKLDQEELEAYGPPG